MFSVCSFAFFETACRCNFPEACLWPKSRANFGPETTPKASQTLWREPPRNLLMLPLMLPIMLARFGPNSGPASGARFCGASAYDCRQTTLRTNVLAIVFFQSPKKRPHNVSWCGPAVTAKHAFPNEWPTMRAAFHNDLHINDNATTHPSHPHLPSPSPAPCSRSTDLNAKITYFQNWTQILQTNFTRPQHPATAENLFLSESSLE